MLWRWLLRKEWKSLDDAFYSKPPINPLRGSYWCWLIQDFNKSPKIWIFITFMGTKNIINGVKSNNFYNNYNSLSTLMGSWFVRNNKITDFFLENSLTEIKHNNMITKSESGYELELSGFHPNYKLSLIKGKKKILECTSKSLDFNNKPDHIYEKSYNTKSFLTNDKKSYWLKSETIRFPMVVKFTNLFTNVDCKFFENKFHGIAYTEKNHSLGLPMPWKYTIFDFEDGSRFRFFWSHKSIIKTPSDLDMTFDCIPTNKKYFFNNENDVEYFYLNKNVRNPHENFCNSSKFIVIKAKNKDGVRIELVAEILNRHLYRYTKWLFHENYNQFILELKKIKIFEKRKEIKININNSVGYGEYVNITVK
jgi:hypothetical protein